MKYFDNGSLVNGDFCNVSEAAIEVSDELFDELCRALEQGKVIEVVDGVPVAVDPPVTVEDYDAAVEAHLRAERIARGYTLREPSDYAGSSVPRWAQDAADWISHRDEVMLYALEILNKAEAGEPVPTLEEFKAALPVIAWTIESESENESESE